MVVRKIIPLTHGSVVGVLWACPNLPVSLVKISLGRESLAKIPLIKVGTELADIYVKPYEDLFRKMRFYGVSFN
jgi:hypothetical protein